MEILGKIIRAIMWAFGIFACLTAALLLFRANRIEEVLLGSGLLSLVAAYAWGLDRWADTASVVLDELVDDQREQRHRAESVRRVIFRLTGEDVARKGEDDA